MSTSTKFFRSFSATTYPVEPLNEVTQDEAIHLVTYYEAKFDSEGQLREFTKRLKQRNGDKEPKWIDMFVEKYDYYPSGCLKQRKLIDSMGHEQTSDFADEPAKWSGYLDDFVGSWFSAFSAPKEEVPNIEDVGLADRLVVCHELVSEFENAELQMMNARLRSGAPPPWHDTRVGASFKEIVQLLVPRGTPRLGFLASEMMAKVGRVSFVEMLGSFKMADFDALEGLEVFREFIPPRENNRLSVPQLIQPNDDLNPQINDWLTANGVKSLFVVPVWSVLISEPLGIVMLFLAKECDRQEIAAISAILRRMAKLFMTPVAIIG